MRNRSTLLLTAGEGHTALPDKGVVAGSETLNRIVDARDFRSPADLVHVLLMPGDADILGERTREQERLLQDHADVPAKVILLYFGDHAATGSQIIEVIKEIHEGRFARPGPAEDSESGTGWNRQGDIV